MGAPLDKKRIEDGQSEDAKVKEKNGGRSPTAVQLARLGKVYVLLNWPCNNRR